MKFLKEEFGESRELDTFISQLERRFNYYYEVTLILDGVRSRRYFAYEEGARDYYNNLVKEAQEDLIYYKDAKIILKRVDIKTQEEELDSILIEE